MNAVYSVLRHKIEKEGKLSLLEEMVRDKDDLLEPMPGFIRSSWPSSCRRAQNTLMHIKGKDRK